MNLAIMSAMMRNGKLISSCEDILNDALNAGQYITIENPDGTRIRLQAGCKIRSLEAVICTPGEKPEVLNFNK